MKHSVYSLLIKLIENNLTYPRKNIKEHQNLIRVNK